MFDPRYCVLTNEIRVITPEVVIGSCTGTRRTYWSYSREPRNPAAALESPRAQRSQISVFRGKPLPIAIQISVFYRHIVSVPNIIAGDRRAWNGALQSSTESVAARRTLHSIANCASQNSRVLHSHLATGTVSSSATPSLYRAGVVVVAPDCNMRCIRGRSGFHHAPAFRVILPRVIGPSAFGTDLRWRSPPGRSRRVRRPCDAAGQSDTPASQNVVPHSRTPHCTAIDAAHRSRRKISTTTASAEPCPGRRQSLQFPRRPPGFDGSLCDRST